MILPYRCVVIAHFSSSFICRYCSHARSLLYFISYISHDNVFGSCTTISNSPIGNCNLKTCLSFFASFVSKRIISSIILPRISLSKRSKIRVLFWISNSWNFSSKRRFSTMASACAYLKPGCVTTIILLFWFTSGKYSKSISFIKSNIARYSLI